MDLCCGRGVEGAGSCGAGLSRYLTKAGVEVVETNHPNKQIRRLSGKPDTVDTEDPTLLVSTDRSPADLKVFLVCPPIDRYSAPFTREGLCG